MTDLSSPLLVVSRVVSEPSLYTPGHFYRWSALETLPSVNNFQHDIWFLVPRLVLVGDVAGDVGGDREELEAAVEDLDDEYGDTDEEEDAVLEPPEPLQHADPCL